MTYLDGRTLAGGTDAARLLQARLIQNTKILFFKLSKSLAPTHEKTLLIRSSQDDLLVACCCSVIVVRSLASYLSLAGGRGEAEGSAWQADELALA